MTSETSLPYFNYGFKVCKISQFWHVEACTDNDTGLLVTKLVSMYQIPPLHVHVAPLHVQVLHVHVEVLHVHG